jgi:hypothetical protein
MRKTFRGEDDVRLVPITEIERLVHDQLYGERRSVEARRRARP